MSDLIPHSQYTFESVRQVRPDGSEFWSARDLMPMLGYSDWRNFSITISRASSSIVSEKMDLTSHVVGVNDLVPRPQGGSVSREDFLLSRYACYLVAMNGDPRKPEISAAQRYFAVRTRQAETAQPLTEDEILHRAFHILDAKVKELTPKAEAYDSFLSADGALAMGTVAKMLGTSRNRLFGVLRDKGVLISQGPMRNTPYQQYAHHFRVLAREYAMGDGSKGCGYTTMVRPTGVNFVRSRVLELSNGLR